MYFFLVLGPEQLALNSQYGFFCLPGVMPQHLGSSTLCYITVSVGYSDTYYCETVCDTAVCQLGSAACHQPEAWLLPVDADVINVNDRRSNHERQRSGPTTSALVTGVDQLLTIRSERGAGQRRWRYVAALVMASDRGWGRRSETFSATGGC